MLFETSSERIIDFRDIASKYGWYNSDNFHNYGAFMDYLQREGFFIAPASTKYHGAYEGGLYDHSKTVTNCLIDLTEKNNLKWSRPESPFIVGMFHDLCKIDQYIQVPNEEPTPIATGTNAFIWGTHYEYNPKLIIKGHGSKSVMLLSQFVNMTEEEIFCIRFHMGTYEKDEWTEFDLAIRKYPNVLWTHMADMLASKVMDV